jgi:hypothetical protein
MSLALPAVTGLDAPTPSLSASSAAFLRAQYERLLTNSVFCANTEAEQIRMFSHKWNYSHSDYFRRTSHQGGHTYMDSSARKEFVRITPDDITNAVFHVSVSRHGSDVAIVRDEVWACIVAVAKWWGTGRPQATDQQSLAVAHIERAGTSFTAPGGSLFPVLVALYFGSYCSAHNLGEIDIVLETYGSKDLTAHEVPDPVQALTADDPRPRKAADTLCDRLQYLPPFQITRFGKDIARSWYKKMECSIGVGCTVRSVRSPVVAEPMAAETVAAETVAKCEPVSPPSASTPLLASPPATTLTATPARADPDVNGPLFPVIACCPLPWADIAGDSKKFFDHSSPAELKPFVPTMHKNFCSTYPVYGNALPQKLQPSTFKATGKVRNLVAAITRPPGSPALRSQQINRVQQYSVTTRHALGQKSGDKHSVAKLSSIPITITNTGKSAVLDTGKCLKQVEDFRDGVHDHFHSNYERGGSARIEIAVACKVNQAEQALEDAVSDVLRLVQEQTVSYDFQELHELAMLLPMALWSRVRCMIAMVETAADTAIVNEELNDVVADTLGAMKAYYSGVGTIHSKQKTLSRTAYMCNRPILCKLPPRCAAERSGVLMSNLTDTTWLELFYECLNSSLSDARTIPVFEPLHPAHRAPALSSHIRGKACPQCFVRFWPIPDGQISYMNHVCAKGSAKHEPDSWIDLDSKQFRAHHTALVAGLTDEQRLLLEALKEDSNVNVYLGGVAGTGKSTVLRAAAEACCMSYGMSSVAILAPTHVAAKNAGGQTVASFLGAKPGTYDRGADELADALSSARNIRMQQELRFLFVDEVGMLTAKDLDRLNAFLRKAMTTTLNEGKTGCFGGMKTILSGDPLQIPPIDLKKNGFFFQSQVYCAPSSRFVVLYLKQVHRTGVRNFLDLQIHGRVAYILARHIEYANKHLGSAVTDEEALRTKQPLKWLYDRDKDDTSISKTQVTLETRRNAYFVNPARIASKDCLRSTPRQNTNDCAPRHPPYVVTLEIRESDHFLLEYERSFQDKLRVFRANDVLAPTALRSSAPLPKDVRLPTEVRLAVGMRVRVLWNDAVASVCKDSTGVVTGFTNTGVLVQIFHSDSEGSVVEVPRVVERIENSSGELVATRTQIPLEPWIAGNHHHVQGQTLARLPTIFANERLNRDHHGVTYTVLSRFQFPEYILLLHELSAADFVAHEVAVRFDQYHAQQQSAITKVDYRHWCNAQGVWQAPCSCKLDSCLLCCKTATLKATTLAFLDGIVNSIPDDPAERPSTTDSDGDNNNQEYAFALLRSGTAVSSDPQFRPASTAAFRAVNASQPVRPRVHTAAAACHLPNGSDVGHELYTGTDFGGDGPGDDDYQYANSAQQTHGITMWDRTTNSGKTATRAGQAKVRTQPEAGEPSAAAGSRKRKKPSEEESAEIKEPAPAPPKKNFRQSLGSLLITGNLSALPSPPPAGSSSKALWEPEWERWLYLAHQKISGTYTDPAETHKRATATRVLKKVGKQLRAKVSKLEYLHCAFSHAFPRAEKSSDELHKCFERVRQNRDFRLLITHTCGAVTQPLPTYHELLVGTDNCIYEFDNAPAHKDHCYWPYIETVEPGPVATP